MKQTLLKYALVVAVLIPLSCFAQSITQTTLAGALSATATSVTLASSAGLNTAGVSDIRTALFIDREYMEVQSTTSANVWTVRRAARGIRGAHASGATVYVGHPVDFGKEMLNPYGNCAPGAQALPFVVIFTGDIFDCPASGPNAGQWTLLNSTGSVVTADANGNVPVGTTVLCAAVGVNVGTAYTLSAANNGCVLTFNNAAAITLTVPAGLPVGFSCLIVQLGAGAVTPTVASTTIFQRASLTKTAGQYAVATLLSHATDTYILAGDLQ